jgi:hypothetical protein
MIMTLVVVVAFLTFAYFLFTGKLNQKRCEADKQIVESSFKGVIIKKYNDKVNVLEIAIGKSVLVQRLITVELFAASKVGDSIIKFEDRNRVLLKPENKFITYYSLTEDCDCLIPYYSN